MSERIDLDEDLNDLCSDYDFSWSEYVEVLRSELKRMYEREDELLDGLRIIRDDLNEGMAQGHLPIESTHGVSARKIRNFANDAFESFKRRESND